MDTIVDRLTAIEAELAEIRAEFDAVLPVQRAEAAECTADQWDTVERVNDFAETARLRAETQAMRVELAAMGAQDVPETPVAVVAPVAPVVPSVGVLVAGVRRWVSRGQAHRVARVRVAA